MIPFRLKEAAEDRRLRGAPLAILVWLHTALVYTEPRPLKQEWVARQLGLSSSTVSAALRLLVAGEYLGRLPPDPASTQGGSRYWLTTKPGWRVGDP